MAGDAEGVPLAAGDAEGVPPAACGAEGQLFLCDNKCDLLVFSI